MEIRAICSKVSVGLGGFSIQVLSPKFVERERFSFNNEMEEMTGKIESLIKVIW